MPEYKDIGAKSEEEQIAEIGQNLADGKTVGFLLDTTPGRVERYIAKIQERWPGSVLVGRWKMRDGVVAVKMGPANPTQRDTTGERN